MRKSLKNIFYWIKTNPAKGSLLILPIMILALWLVLPTQVRAIDFEGAIVGVLGWIFSFFVYILGNLLVKFIDLLVWVAQYNDFVNAEAVKVGWTVVRDVANMFFIVGLLVISFGTVFRIQEYRYNSLLSRLIIMAILINFSKTIAAFFIDLSQVIMLTFVNAFKDMAAGNLTSGFGVDKIVSFSQNASAAGGDISILSVAGAMFAAVIMLFVATVVVAIFALYLIQRIVMLWIYIILAPMAFMLHIFPGNLGSFWSTWWRDFTQYVVRGPVIAFFLWLTLTIISLSQATTAGSILGSTPAESSVGQLGTSTTQDLSATASEATTSANILNYLMAMGLLVAGLMQTAKAGGAAGSVAGKWMGNFQKWGAVGVTAPLGAALFLPRKITKEFGGGVVKRVAYPIADVGLGVMSKIPGIKGYMGMQRAKLKGYRDSKDRAALERTDLNSLMAMQGVMPTDAGRANRAEAASVILAKHGKKYAKLSMGNKMRIWKHYADGKGFKLHYDKDTKKVTDEYESDRGRSEFNAAVSKNPALWSVMLNQLKQDEGTSDKSKMSEVGQAKYERILGKARQQADKMTTASLNEMSTDFLTQDWGDPDKDKNWQATRQRYNEDLEVRKVFTEAMAKRLKNPKYIDTYDKNVIRDQRLDIGDAYRSLKATGNWDYNEELYESPDLKEKKGNETIVHEDFEAEYQRDIDQARQQRTAERVAEYRQQGLDFYQSAEYRSAQDQYYDKNSFDLNERQRERLEGRALAKKRGEEDYLSGLKSFAAGSSNMLAVDKEVLDKAGVKLAAGGHAKDKAAVAKLAGVMSEKLNGDIANIESQITGLNQEEAELRKPSGLTDVYGRSTTQADQNPEKMKEIADYRQALEARRDSFAQVQKRLDSEEGMEDIQFINKDSYTGNRWNLVAEEATHKKLDQIDPDGSFRKSLMDNMSPEEVQTITQAIRDKTGDQTLNSQKAFEEYLTKGLVNVRGEKYKDTAPDAVKLKDGLALAVKRQAEARGVKLNMLDLEPEEIQAPGKVGVASSSREASKRKATQPARIEEEADETPATSAAQDINITNNIRQEINSAIRGAPQSFRDTMNISPASLDNAMRSSLVMRSLINNLQTGFNEVAQTKKLSGLAQTEITKRINNLQKHVDNNDGDSFKDEFSSLQRAIGESGGSEGE